MKKEQLVVFGLIVLVGIGVFLFGQTKSGPGPDVYHRVMDTLKKRKLPVLVAVHAGRAESRAYVDGVKQAIADSGARDARLVMVNVDDPNEKEAVISMRLDRAPLVVVVGLDGEHVYATEGQYDTAKMKAAIAEGLTKTPLKIEEPEPGEHHH